MEIGMEIGLRKGYGEYLTGKRIEKGLTIKKLSEMSGVPENTLLNIEKENEVALGDLKRLLIALKIDSSEVWND